MKTRRPPTSCASAPTSRPRRTCDCAVTCAASACSTSGAVAAQNAVALRAAGGARDRGRPGRRRARSTVARSPTQHEVRVEWHASDVADLAFLRADSIDLALAAGLLAEVDDVDRLFRQVHRVLRAGGAFVFSYDHPMALAVGRDDVAPGGFRSAASRCAAPTSSPGRSA